MADDRDSVGRLRSEEVELADLVERIRALARGRRDLPPRIQRAEPRIAGRSHGGGGAADRTRRLAVSQTAAAVARAVRRVNRKRLEFVGAAFAELGFEGDELEMRTRLFVVYQSFEAPMFREVSRKRRRELIERRIELLTES